MIRQLATIAAALTLLAGTPTFAQERGSAEQEFSLLNADRAYRLGQQQFRLQHYDAAVRQFEKAVSLAPGVDTYRNSLYVTRQRLAQQQATQKANKQNLDRTRRAFGADEAETSEQGEPDRPKSERVGSKTDPRVPGESPESMLRGSGEPPTGEDMLRDEGRDLRLGGGNLGPSRLPPDLPIAGSTFDLPVFAMPRELLAPRVESRTRPDDLEPPDDVMPEPGQPKPPSP